jgi:tryptophan synthase alpha chain
MDRVFSKILESGEKILVTNFPIGDTILVDDLEWGQKYFDNGSSTLEICLPYEKPVLDGSVVSSSMARALKNTTLDKVFDTIKKLRKRHPDQVLHIMCYFEIIEKYGIKEFAKICDHCGVDAVLAPNTPLELYSEMDTILGEYNIHNIRFVPFHINEAIIDDLKKNAKGYIFLQAVDGATGPQESVSHKVAENIKLMKDKWIATPVVAGFGISTPDQVKEVIDMGADGVIVGSALINSIADGYGEAFIESLSQACKTNATGRQEN